MSNSGLDKLVKNQKEYEKMVSELEYLLDNEDIIIEDVEEINSYFDSVEKVLYKIKNTTSKIIKKILVSDIKKNKNLDKESLEYNKALLYGGKPHKAIEKITSLANEGSMEAQLLLGKTYLTGIIGNFGERLFLDDGLSVIWLNRAYKSGSIEAGYLLGVAEQKVLNIENAINIFNTLAEKDHLRSLNELLIIYKNHPVYKNDQKYFNILEKLNSLKI